MNKVSIGLAIAIVGIVLYVGGLIYWEMVNELDNNPDIKDIGGPPVITDLRLVVIVIAVATIFCGIVLRMKPKEAKINNQTK